MRRGQLESQLLILITLALVAFGLVMVYSATSAPAALGNGDPMQYLKRQTIYAVIGIALMIVTYRMPFRRWRALAPTLIVVSGCLLLAVLAIGTTVNGAKRWIGFGPAAFQPSELAKLAVAVWVASYLTRRRPPQTLKELARPLGALIAVFCVLLLAEPDLGTAIALVVVAASILLVAGTPMRPLLAGFGLLTFLGLAAIWVEPYRRERVFSFLNPWGDAQGSGYQTVQAIINNLDSRIDIETFDSLPEPAELGVNDIGEIRLRTSKPLIFDGYGNNRLTGSFILVEQGTNQTVAAGMLYPPTELVKPEYNDFAI